MLEVTNTTLINLLEGKEPLFAYLRNFRRGKCIKQNMYLRVACLHAQNKCLVVQSVNASLFNLLSSNSGHVHLPHQKCNK